MENGQDPDNIHTKLQSITLEFDHQDIPYWFSQAEMQMEICGIKSQWMKRIILQWLLPKKVAINVKGLLSKSKTEAGNSINKDIKDRILQILGPKEQDLYRKANSLVMVDTPSQLARTMVDLL